jgi:cell division ATPase FtsA
LRRASCEAPRCKLGATIWLVGGAANLPNSARLARELLNSKARLASVAPRA